MPNRILKESIRSSDSLNGLSWFEECLFYRLIVSCDDYGRFDGRPAIIKGTCFPLKDVTVKNIESALSKLASAGLVRHYIVEGKPYLSLSGWERHQNIRAKKSKYPSPDDGEDISNDETCKQMHADENICMQMRADVPVIQSNPNPIRESQSESYSEDPRVNAALLEFAEFRKQIKKPMTKRAMELAVKKLQDMTDDVDEQIAIIDQSIMNGWQGLFPLKNDRKKGGTSTGSVYDEWRDA